jgi:hypothetical protein
MPASSRANSRSTPNWTDAEVNILLNHVEEFMPMGSNGWQKVARLFNACDLVHHARDVDSCKRKFVKLKNHAKPTGDPDCPPLVKRAKRLQYAIDNHAAVVSLDDEEKHDDEESQPDNDYGLSSTQFENSEVFDQDDDHNDYRYDEESNVNDSEIFVNRENDGSIYENTHVMSNDDYHIPSPPPEIAPTRRRKSLPIEKPNRTGLSQIELVVISKRVANSNATNFTTVISVQL